MVLISYSVWFKSLADLAKGTNACIIITVKELNILVFMNAKGNWNVEIKATM